jgi:beta-glucosidase
MTLAEKVAQMHGVQDTDRYRIVPGLPRLGIPALKVTNGPAGIGPGGAGMQPRATAFPAPVSLAATWDVDLAYRFGQLAGNETRSLGSNLLEAPDVNIVRVPQSGRAFETFGEDPYLTSRVAVAVVKGIQSAGVLANIKHYTANNQETDRGSINEIIGERALKEIYLPAFEAAVKEARVASVMCAYPRVNGAFDCENTPLLRTILKDEWKFDGFVTSDFGAVHSAIPSLKAGLDLEFPRGLYFGEKLEQAVQNKQVQVEQLDEALVRRFSKMMELGLWGTQMPAPAIPILEHGIAARQIAEQGMVLLKNEGDVLPLNYKSLKSVALIGPYAVRPMSGGGGSSKVIPFYTIDPADGIAAHLLSQTPLDVIDGTEISTAMEAAKKRDVAIVMVGDDEGEDHDHAIALSQAQDKLIEAVAAVNPRTIVVLKTGSAVLMPWLDKVAAVLEAWYPGEEDGNAVARVLFGEANPSGHLPVSFPRSTQDTLAQNSIQYPGDHVTVQYSEGLAVGYRWFQKNRIKPLFPFGYGLSYTSFRFSDLEVRRQPNGSATASFRLTNTGKREGAEVAQMYLSFPNISEGDEPPLQLKAFEKIVLKAGESRRVEWTLPERAFAFWSVAQGDWLVPHGTFTFHLGASSEDLPLGAELSLH